MIKSILLKIYIHLLKEIINNNITLIDNQKYKKEEEFKKP